MGQIAVHDRKRWPHQWGLDKPNRVFGDGRRCAEPDCPTILSRYTEGDKCSVHEPALDTEQLAEERRH